MASSKRMTKAEVLSDPLYSNFQMMLHASPAQQKEIRRAYTALRDAGQKQVSRLMKSKYGKLENLSGFKSGFKKLSEIKNPAQLAAEMHKLMEFSKSDTLSVKGQKELEKTIIENMNEAYSHYDPKTGMVTAGNLVTTENYIEFRNFLDYVGSKGRQWMYEGRSPFAGVDGVRGNEDQEAFMQRMFEAWQENPARPLAY